MGGVVTMKKLQRFIALLLAVTLVFSGNVKANAGQTVTDENGIPIYTVMKGDFLWKIAFNELGDGDRYYEIYKLNKDIVKDPDLIFPGQKLIMPADAVAEAPADETVETGDDLVPGSSAAGIGDEVNGFKVVGINRLDLINADLIVFEHEKTGARVMYIANDDTNRAFDITFRTPAINDSGIPHVFEHSTLDGSEKYPSKSLFFNLSYQTYNTYMNASTYNFMTTFPVASLSEAQLLKYADYYTDSCFNPIVVDNDSIFLEEAWRYVMNDADSDLTIAGTVYSEMNGAYNIDSAASYNFYKALYPGSTIGNVSGGHPAHIPEMTWEDLCEYHDTYYHPSNSYSYLYGKYDDADAFLALLGSYFDAYEKKDIVIDDAAYEPLTKSVEKVCEFGLADGADTENGAIIYYGFALDAETDEEIAKLDLLSTLLVDESSAFAINMKNEMPQAGYGCYIDFAAPGTCLYFYAEGVNAEDTAQFKSIVDSSLKTIAEEGFDTEAVDAIAAAYKMSIMLTPEDSALGVSMIPNLAYYWAGMGNEFGYNEFIASLDKFEEYNNNGTFKKVIADQLLDEDVIYALVTTVPVAGLKDAEDAALAAELAEIKAGMSKKEIKNIVKQTAEYAQEEAEDNTEYIRELTAVDVASLPEEARIYDFKDKTDKNGIRHVDVCANVDDIGEATILLDAAGLKFDQIHYFKLYTDLLGSLDTKNYTVAQLTSKINRYMSSPTVKVSLMTMNDEEIYHPYMRASFIAMDEDMKTCYDIMYELIFRTKLNADKIKGEVTALKTSVKNSINSNAYTILYTRGEAREDIISAYSNYINYLDYYDFLCKVEEMLDSSEGREEVIAQLKAIQKYFKNDTNAISGFVGNEESISNHRKAANAFFKKLPSADIKAQTYTFPEITDTEAIIIDGAVNYNNVYASFDTLGIDDVDASINVVTSYVTDAFLYPMLRDQYGVYSILHGATENGLVLVSYRDPNVLETFQVYAELPELVKSLSEVDQETLDGYILSNYSGYAMPQGELTGGFNAMFDIIGGFDQELVLDSMKDLKNCTPEKAAAYAQMYADLVEKGMMSTAGSAASINQYADLYETIYNPFGAVDKSKIEFEDVESGEFYGPVHFCFENNLMMPESETVFGIDSPVTLGELAVGFCGLIDYPAEAADAIEYLAYFGILPADGQPDAVLSREEMFAYTEYFFMALGIEFEYEYFSETLIMNLEDAPEENATRGELASILYTLGY